MTEFVTLEGATVRDMVTEAGEHRRSHDYFGLTSPRKFGPEGFLVNYGPNRSSVAHFHSVDQFQLFFGVPGAFYQRHPISAAMLRYNDAFVTYGPFGAADEAMRFFTLWPEQGSFIGYMPEARDRLPYRGRRHLEVDLEGFLQRDLPGPGRIVVEELIAPEDDDGLGAWAFLAGPDAAVCLSPDGAVVPNGQYVSVLRGEVELRGERFGPQSLGWVGPGDDPPVVEATAEGACVLLLRYPHPLTPEARRAEIEQV